MVAKTAGCALHNNPRHGPKRRLCAALQSSCRQRPAIVNNKKTYYNAGRLHALCINYAVHAPDNFVSVDYVKTNGHVMDFVSVATGQSSCGCCKQLNWVTPSTG